MNVTGFTGVLYSLMSKVRQFVPWGLEEKSRELSHTVRGKGNVSTVVSQELFDSIVRLSNAIEPRYGTLELAVGELDRIATKLDIL